MSSKVSNIKDFGNNIGLLYITSLDGSEFLNSGIPNNIIGVEAIKLNALNRSPIGFARNPESTIVVSNIAVNGNVTAVNINGVNQISSSLSFVVGAEETTATKIAEDIMLTTPISGINYNAYASGDTVYIYPANPVGDSVNGHLTTTASTGTITFIITNVSGGQDGTGVNSEINGRRYWLNANYDASGCVNASPALSADLTNAVEITNYVIKRGLETSLYTESVSVTPDKRISEFDRISAIQYLELSNGAPTDLESIIIDSSGIGDIIILSGGGFAATLKDVSTISGGNIKLSSQEDFIVTDNTDFIALKNVVDSIYGSVWTEMNRSKLTIATDAVTTPKIINDAVTTVKIIDDAVTTLKIINDAVTTAKIIDDAVTTPKIINDAVTTAKILDANITLAKLAALSVDSSKIVNDSVITAKILNGNVTLEKLESSLLKELVVVPVTFEDSAEMGLIKITIPYDCNVVSIDAAITKLIEATDDAVIIPKDHGGTVMTAGQLDLTAGVVLGNIFTSTPTGNNSFAAGEVLSLETSKTTVGGKALVSVALIRT